MARPKAADPKVAITLRLPKSVMDIWADRAEQRGRSAREHMEAKLIDAVRAAPAIPAAVPRPAQVTPNFKGAGR